MLSSRPFNVAGCWAGPRWLVSPIIRGWQAAYGQSNISAVPVAGCPTPLQGSSIYTSIQVVLSARFARPKFTRGQAIMIFSIGRSIRWSRPPLGKGGSDGNIGILGTCAASPCQPSGEQTCARRRKLNKSAAVVDLQPAPFNGELHACAVLCGSALVAE